MKKYTDEVEFDSEGNQFHYNKKGQLHREDGPAVHYASGRKVWFLKGVSYSEKQFLAKMNLPFIDSDGTKGWYNEKGQFHREDGPAVEYPNGHKFWYLNNVQYSEKQFLAKMNLPVIDDKGNKIWFNEAGQRHRDDGPAVIWNDGSKSWYKNGLRHRDDGPAVEDVIDGPSWYLNGDYLTKTQFMDIKNKAKRIEMNKIKVVKMTMAEVNKMAGCIVEIVESH